MILKDILSESKEYYLAAQKKIGKRLAQLPGGSVKERVIAGHKYYYLQSRAGKKVVHKYLGKERPDEAIKQIQERRALQKELKKVLSALQMIKRSEGRRRG